MTADLALAAACGGGDERARAMFQERFSPLFVHVAHRTAAQWRMPLGASDRDAIVAETLLHCLRDDAAAVRGFTGTSSLATYLAVIARRVAVRMLSARMQAGRPASTEHVVDRGEVERLLTRLDEAEARLVRLHHLEGRSYGEISRLTGMPLGSIGPALSRAKVKMRAAAVTAAAEDR